MAEGRLSNEEFFTQLTSLLSSATSKNKNSVFLTQKPLQSSAPTDTISPLLVRATNGDKDKSKKIKLTTVVAADDLDKFFARYADVCKANMGSLKKRDRKKRKERMRKKEKAPAA